MHLVNDQNDIAAGLDLADEIFHAAFKLAAELRAGHHGGHIQQKDLFVQKLIGHLAVCDLLGKALGDGGLANARLTDQTGIVLLTAVEDLNDALGLLFAANDLVELVLTRTLGQIQTEGVKEFVLFPVRLAGAGLSGGCLWRLLLFGGRLGVVVLRGKAAEQLVEEGEGRRLTGQLVVLIAILVRIAAQHRHHFAADRVDILVADAHLLDHIIHLLDAKLLGTFEAQALVGGLSIFDFCDKHHRHVLSAAAAKRWFQGRISFRQGI